MKVTISKWELFRNVKVNCHVIIIFSLLICAYSSNNIFPIRHNENTSVLFQTNEIQKHQ